MGEEKKFVDNLGPRSAFKFGLISGLGIMFAIGFFVVLGLLVSGKTENFNLTNTNNNTNNEVVNNQPAQPTGNINVTVASDDWVRGDKNAPITILEFSDVDCPYCERYHETMKQILAEYDGDVNWAYRHFPLTSLHPNTDKKSEAAECVGNIAGNDKFWEYLDVLITDKTITVDTLATAAGKIGVNSNQIQDCLDSGKFTNKISAQTQQAIAAGGQGTPYSIIIAGDQRTPINGALPFETIADQLDALLQ